jgi:hypothetical protein
MLHCWSWRLCLRVREDDGVCVAAPKAKRVAHRHLVLLLPRHQLPGDDEPVKVKVDLGVDLGEVERGHDDVMLHHEQYLDQAQHSGSGLGVADVGLGGPQVALAGSILRLTFTLALTLTLQKARA